MDDATKTIITLALVASAFVSFCDSQYMLGSAFLVLALINEYV